MPLPVSVLGSGGNGLSLDPRDSGARTNAAAAADATGKVTGAQLTRLGRITGYQLDYSDPAAYAQGHGLIELTTGVDVYHDAGAASRALTFWRQDDLLNRTYASSLMSVSVKWYSAGAVGGRSYALLFELAPAGAPPVYETDLAFTRGDLLGAVSLTGASGDGIEAEAAGLAQKLSARIRAARAGRLRGRPVRVPPKPKAGPPARGPDPSKLVLRPADLGGGKVKKEGYTVGPERDALSTYDRQMTPAGSFPFLESEVSLFQSTDEARFIAAALGATFASPAAAKRELGPTIGGQRITGIHTETTPIGVPGASAATLVTVTVADRAALVFEFVVLRDGAAVELLSAVTTATAASLTTLQTATQKASDRLHG